jgi:alpha-L-fucosidase 2
MPLGNGDIGLNAWVEKDDDLLFYISKTDAWAVAPNSAKGLIKLGRIRIRMTPNPFAAGLPFTQVLRLQQGEIDIQAGSGDSKMAIRLWVDANHPVVHTQVDAEHPIGLQATLETWRPEDKILPAVNNQVIWYHRDGVSGGNPGAIAALNGRTFGALIRGKGLFSSADATLRSRAPAPHWDVTLYPLTQVTPTPGDWVAALQAQQTALDAVNVDAAYKSHLQWWHDFWNRSWIFVEGGADAETVTRGYELQRFITACAGRGADPIKFNGSIFNVDYTSDEVVGKTPDGKNISKPTLENADYRRWGGNYWFQNTRAIYWPLLAMGDFDMMKPLFRMYRTILENNRPSVKSFYSHDGSYINEVNPIWGGLPNLTPDFKGGYTTHYFTPVLELSAMMLDYYAYTQDDDFARKMLIPVADAGVTFFEGHFPKGPDGKLLLDPDNAIETFWKARNPTPDIAGLHFVLEGLLALPPELTDERIRARWQNLLGEIPDVPIGLNNSTRIVLPAEIFDGGHNSENPELYAVYPFRIYAVGKPNLDLAIATYNHRKYKRTGGWVQDPVQAAYLGLTDEAKKWVIGNASQSDPQLRFPAFWASGADYAPNQCNGGNLETALEKMLMQPEGKRILILPAWPKDWNASFKLHAPGNTIVEGSVHGGQLLNLKVTPPERRNDVMMIGSDGQPASLPVSAFGN